VPSSDPNVDPSIDPDRFRQVLGHFPTGVTAVTAIGRDGGPVGFSVSSFFSVSLEPALVGFCAGKESSAWPAIRAARSFCVNVLAADQESVSRQLASRSDRFEGLAWSPSPSGAPRLHDVLAWIDCDIDAVHDAGDHEICVARVRDLAVAREAGPLVYYRSGYGQFSQ
jgi:3-hydroxy-9,10-secoandrosta-1,3,5(10)-triene-9,17-dione monooxygenase reductase component